MGKFQRVTQQIGQDLAQPRAVNQQHVGNVGRNIDQQLNAFFARPRHVGANKRLNEGADRDGLRLQLHFAGFNPGKVENVVDDMQQRLGRTHHQRQVIALIGTERGIEAQLGHANNAVHGGANFMAHIRQERAFCLIGFLCLNGRGERLNFSLLAARNILQRANHALGVSLNGERDHLAGEQHPAQTFARVMHANFAFKDRTMILLRRVQRLAQRSAIVLVDLIEQKTHRISPLGARLAQHGQQGIVDLERVARHLPVPDPDMDGFCRQQKIVMQLMTRPLCFIQLRNIAVQADNAAVRKALVLDEDPPLACLPHFAVFILPTVAHDRLAQRLAKARVDVVNGVDKAFRQRLQRCAHLQPRGDDRIKKGHVVIPGLQAFLTVINHDGGRQRVKIVGECAHRDPPYAR